MQIWRRRGYLPHSEAHQGIYFVTFRVAGSLPSLLLKVSQGSQLLFQLLTEFHFVDFVAGQGLVFLSLFIEPVQKDSLLRFGIPLTQKIVFLFGIVRKIVEFIA